jgi:hypothetical protein
MAGVAQVLGWVQFMDAEAVERYKIEVQQTWAGSLGLSGRFVARHYSWFLGAFKRIGLVKIALAWLLCLGLLVSRAGVWDKTTIVWNAAVLCAAGGLLLWCYTLSSAIASNWKRVDYKNFRNQFVPKELQTIVFDAEPQLPEGARLVVEYFGRHFLLGVVEPQRQIRYFGCWSGKSTTRSTLLFPFSDQ